MKNTNRKFHLIGRATAIAFVVAAATIAVSAQDVTSKTVSHGPKEFDTEVKNAEVVYVEGNDLVLRVDNGKIEHLVVPDSDKFTIDGKEVTVHELVPGTRLTQTITTATAPRYVKTVRTLKGKVWHVNAPGSVMLTLPEGESQIYRIPSHAKITINGEKKTAFDLRKGMTLEATIVTDDTQTVIERGKAVVGKAPPPPATPREIGLLLFAPSPSAPAEPASAEQGDPAVGEELAEALPRTGSFMPLTGLFGALGVAASLGLRAV
jgi:hypothetical protein